jgi:hypothetical protein
MAAFVWGVPLGLMMWTDSPVLDKAPLNPKETTEFIDPHLGSYSLLF